MRIWLGGDYRLGMNSKASGGNPVETGWVGRKRTEDRGRGGRTEDGGRGTEDDGRGMEEEGGKMEEGGLVIGE